jgi:HAD superfamily hydrolase (TIGR01450 family)
MRGTLVSTARGVFAYSASKLLFTHPSPPMMVSGWTACRSLTRKQRLGQSSMSSARGNRESDSVVCKSTTDITESIRLDSEVEMQKVSELFKANSPRAVPLLIHTHDQLASYMSSNQIHNYLFDCDGVLYRGADPMPSASRTIEYLINSGKQVFFVTNNAQSTRMELKLKLEKVLNLPKGLMKEEMIIGSAYVASRYLTSCLSKKSNNVRRVHVIGTSGLCQEFQSAGFDISGGPDIIGTACGMSRDELAAYPFPEGEIDAMVIGLDPDFNYRKLCIATVLLQRNPHAILVATNRDSFDLVGVDARHLP